MPRRVIMLTFISFTPSAVSFIVSSCGTQGTPALPERLFRLSQAARQKKCRYRKETSTADRSKARLRCFLFLCRRFPDSQAHAPVERNKPAPISLSQFAGSADRSRNILSTCERSIFRAASGRMKSNTTMFSPMRFSISGLPSSSLKCSSIALRTRF